MPLLDLPDELLLLCCEQTDMLAARALRLSCKRLAPLFTKRLFSHFHLLPTTDSANKARSILENRDLMPLVTTISIKASLDEWDSNVDSHPTWDVTSWADDDLEDPDQEKYGIDLNGEPSHAYKRMLNDIGLFGNLRRVEVVFDWDAHCDDNDVSGNHKEWTAYRDPFLKSVFAALNHSDHPAGKVHSLCIHNLADLSNYELLKSDDFKTVISRLDTLELSIAAEECESAPESEIEYPERHIFFGKDLIEYWLAPTQSKLVNLKIYSNCYWGYLPKCDFRPLHFPLLQSLAFGNMTFTHDWQLDWILSHGKTLQSLTLDDCPIVHDALMTDYQTDPERYVILQDHAILQSADTETHWSYAPRWHDYFAKITTGLPYLQRFGIGHGPWNSCYGEDKTTAPFLAAAELPARLRASRYVIFHGGTGPCQWIEPENSREWTSVHDDEDGANYKGRYDSCWDEDDVPPPPAYPDCWGRDQEALDELLAAVEGRRKGGGRG
jgi:hypothetical protein